MKKRIGLIGCGEIGALRASAIGHSKAVELLAVSDLDHSRGQQLARRYNCSATADWRQLIDRDDLDAVIVSTPPNLHAEMSIAALNAGKHVLCEKPLARTPEECAAMVQAALQNDRWLATGFNYRFYPSVRKARALLNTGAIGELDHIRSYSGYSAKEHNHDWLHDVQAMGGGALRDNGIHLIDLTQYFLGDVAEVKGFGQENVWKFNGCEDNGFALLKSSRGKIASLQASWTEWKGYRFVIEIYGTLGCIRVSCFPMITQIFSSSKLGDKPRRKSYWFPKVHLMEHLYSYRWIVTQSFVDELNAFARMIDGDKTEIATGLDGLRAVEIAAEAANSSSTNNELKFMCAHTN